MTTVPNSSLATAAFASLLAVTSPEDTTVPVAIDPVKIYRCFVQTSKIVRLELWVELSDRTKIQLSMVSTDTVKDLKTKIEEQTKKSITGHFIYTSTYEKRLEEARTLEDCHISTGSTVHVFADRPGTIIIDVDKQRYVYVEAEPNATIENIKMKIRDQEGISPQQQKLSCRGLELTDNMTLSDNYIRGACVLKLTTLQPQRVIQIFLQTSESRRIALDVKTTYSIEYIKKLIHDQERIPVEHQRLTYAARQLEDHRGLWWYGVKEGSTLFLTVRTANSITVFLQTVEGTREALDVELTDTIGNIKKKIQDRDEIPPEQQRLFFVGKELKDDRTLNEYNIQDGCTLSLILREGGMVRYSIQVRMPDGNPCELQVKQTDTVEEVKAMLRSKNPLLTDALVLSYSGVLLEQHQTLAQHGIVQGSVLNAHENSSGLLPTQIEIRSAGEKSVQMKVLPTCSIGYLKQLAERRFGSECTQQHQLYFKGIVLDNEKYFSDYEALIPDGSVIILRRKCTLIIQPNNIAIFVNDHDSIGEIKVLIKQRTGIPVDRQVLFMRGTFQYDDRAQVLNREVEEEVYVVDSATTKRLIAVELPQDIPRAVVVDESSTSDNLRAQIEEDFGYADQFQCLISEQNGTRVTPFANGDIIHVEITTSNFVWRTWSLEGGRSTCTLFGPLDTAKIAIDHFAQQLGVLPKRIKLSTPGRVERILELKLPMEQYLNVRPGQIINVKVLEPIHKRLEITLFSGKTFQLIMSIDDSIQQLKRTIEHHEGIPADYQVILRGNQELQDREIIDDCLEEWSCLLQVKFKLTGPLALEPSSFAPHLDFDFTDIVDQNETFTRGNYPYERPCGGKLIALNVAGKYGLDDRWLGMTGTDPEEWPVSYHGTGRYKGVGFAEQGVRLSKGENFVHDRGIYSTPELEVAKLYAKEFEYEGAKYKMIFQNRVNPKYIKVIRSETTEIGTYWLSTKGEGASNDNISDLIRPYAICIFRA